MFGIGPMEMIVIVILALIVLGPEKFPEAGRAVGRFIRDFRSTADSVTRELTLPLDEPRYSEPKPSPEDVATQTAVEPAEQALIEPVAEAVPVTEPPVETPAGPAPAEPLVPVAESVQVTGEPVVANAPVDPAVDTVAGAPAAAESIEATVEGAPESPPDRSTTST